MKAKMLSMSLTGCYQFMECTKKSLTSTTCTLMLPSNGSNTSDTLNDMSLAVITDLLVVSMLLCSYESVHQANHNPDVPGHQHTGEHVIVTHLALHSMKIGRA